MKKSLISTLVCCLICITTINARTTIKLSETEWKFDKVVPHQTNIAEKIAKHQSDDKIKDLLSGHISSLSIDNTYNEFVIDLRKEEPISALKLMFSEQTRSVAYKITGSNSTDFHSDNLLIDYTKTPHTCTAEYESQMGSIGETVGFVQKFKNQYVLPALDGMYRYLKVEFETENPISLTGVDVLIQGKTADKEENNPTSLDFDDSSWETVGLPHCYNAQDSYLNSTSTYIWKGEVWYRNKFKLRRKDRNKRFILEFKSIGIAASVYINGVFKEGNTTVDQPGNLTHLGCFIPFAIDITDEVYFDKENILAVKISNSENSFFTWPNFGVWEAFGMGWGGIYSDVNLIVTDEIHIPSNYYSASNEWGTYNAVRNIADNQAELSLHTNIKNNSHKKKNLQIKIQLIDENGVTKSEVKEKFTVNPHSSSNVELDMLVNEPTLWYPNNSPHGKPYIYTLRRIITERGRVKDIFDEDFGIRTIDWDDDYCYVNGHKHLLRGFGHRNMYPALGCAIPTELQWKDIAYIAQCGANTLRVGHAPPLPGFLEACNHYGIMLILNSGDNEWSLKNEPTNTYKREFDRNAIIAFRNHPSVIVWESNNGLAKDGDIYYPSYTLEIAEKYDPVNTRIVMNRDWYPPKWDENKPVLVGFTNWYTKINGSPSLNTEVYGANWEGRASWNIARFDYDNEKRFSRWYINDYLEDIQNDACGWLDWMLAETQGESYTIYLNGKRNQKSLGSCAMDANRFPKLKYRVYEHALWVPYESKPGVTLQSTWDFDYPIQNISAWSNCPYVELVVNDRSYGVRDNTSETKECRWENIVWEPGIVVARGLDHNKELICSDTIRSSKEPYGIKLIVEPLLTKPDGSSFSRKANGSDVTIVTAMVVDIDGNLCTRADLPINFELEGDAEYCGSADFYITEGENIYYHTPGDKELQSEGGLLRVAIKAGFKPGKVSLKASSHDLNSGVCSIEFH